MTLLFVGLRVKVVTYQRHLRLTPAGWMPTIKSLARMTGVVSCDSSRGHIWFRLKNPELVLKAAGAEPVNFFVGPFFPTVSYSSLIFRVPSDWNESDVDSISHSR
jgi:hypothetical protein